ncbi:hypothetical protein [Intestinimonas butyriciproducens]|uniref:hypothetical protein n=1 Tax=Intestinimonas butyriciproducens TaxID=1297617 RepID=UPI00242AD222|nr:hypothetical protein [Intestinimonas butyriciproducens]MCI6364457.1 hypothetical protein [Intestinimonas butyriciproducens]
MIEQVSISSRTLSYELSFRGKYSILTGLSGSGKTRFVKFLDRIGRGMPHTVSGGYEVIGAPYGKALRSAVLSKHGAIIVVDEDVDRSDLRAAMHDIMNSDCYFIFITRDTMPDIPYGVENVFEMVGGPNHYRMVPKYTLQKCNLTSTNIVCEDAASGLKITDAIFKKYGYKVTSASGRKRLIAAARKEAPEGAIVLADLCGTGDESGELIDFVTLYPQWQLCYSKSFEWELLRHPYVNRIDCADPDNTTLVAARSEEAYYTAVVSNELKTRYGIGYDKGGDNVVDLLLTGHAVVGSNHIKLPAPSTDTWLYPDIPRGYRGLIAAVPSGESDLILTFEDGHMVTVSCAHLGVSKEDLYKVKISDGNLDFGSLSVKISDLIQE